MQVRAEQLEAQLAKTLAPVYAIHGDEPLLALEAADAVRAAARQRGHAEREVFEPGRHFDWSEFTHSACSLSLFASKKIIELRLPSGKPGVQGAEAIGAYCEAPGADNVLLVTLPRLDRAGQGSAWFGALARSGVQVDIYPLERARVPSWIAGRLARQKQSAPAEVLEYIADRVEGNLLAAHQEMLKLALLAPQGELTLEVVTEAVASVARYDPFDAAAALLSGNIARYLRVIEGLRGEGEQPTFVLYVLSSSLFVLQGIHAGSSAQALFGQHRLFDKRLQKEVPAASRRFPAANVDRALSDAADIDRAIKGVGAGNAWEAFMTLGLKLARGSKA